MTDHDEAAPAGDDATGPARRPSTKRLVDHLDVRERRLGFAAAGVAAVVAVVIYFVEADNPKFHVHKGQFTPQTTLIVGLVCAGLLLLTAFIGRRAPVGFVALFTGIAFLNFVFIGAIFLAYAFWLLWRSWKVQREAATAQRAARTSEGVAARPTPRARRSTVAKEKTAPKSAAPEANKRYTPKAPKRPAPPPPKLSRRERRQQSAAQDG
jgi:hypothetical protein